jgi:hypothetical protein
MLASAFDLGLDPMDDSRAAIIDRWEWIASLDRELLERDWPTTRILLMLILRHYLRDVATLLNAAED